MQIKIIDCSNSLLWYYPHVGEEFTVSFEEENAYWTRELQFPFSLNWVYKHDAEILKETND